MRDRPEIRCEDKDVTDDLRNTKIVLPDIVVLRQISHDAKGCNSEPGSRSSSFKHSEKPKYLHVKFESIRRKSMPDNVMSPEEAAQIQDHVDALMAEPPQQIQRVRSFKISSKGIVNRGDSFRRSSLSNSQSSLSKSDSTRRTQSPLCKPAPKQEKVVDLLAPDQDVFQVSIVGAMGVGKTAIKHQFVTSEYMGNLDTFSVESGQETAVPVMLDDEESIVLFTDYDDAEDCDVMSNKDAIVLVFSVTDRKSYNFAVDCLLDLRQTLKSNQVIILVANKADIVRGREITSEEAKATAEQYRCKYVETSASLNHKIDELLVGVLKQIRLQKKGKGKESKSDTSGGSAAAATGANATIPDSEESKPEETQSESVIKRFFKGLFGRFSKKKDNVDNLYN
ncbi:GTP-binding protein REM 1-like [Ylistrum balloti]|uniref:GTP-binding protein REM 1-like n=1 Tax=Ylistrum balloti TaxID=509963 RepID=UPI002905BC2D|nr:GTP-binding protein REM 1-like [Ylistrum balloti]